MIVHDRTRLIGRLTLFMKWLLCYLQAIGAVRAGWLRMPQARLVFGRQLALFGRVSFMRRERRKSLVLFQEPLSRLPHT